MAGLVPCLDTMNGGNRALEFVGDPAIALQADRAEPGQHGLKRRRRGGYEAAFGCAGVCCSCGICPDRVGRLQADDRVIEFFAIAARNGLHPRQDPAVGSSGNPGLVTTLGTLVSVRPAHTYIKKGRTNRVHPNTHGHPESTTPTRERNSFASPECDKMTAKCRMQRYWRRCKLLSARTQSTCLPDGGRAESNHK